MVGTLSQGGQGGAAADLTGPGAPADFVSRCRPPRHCWTSFPTASGSSSWRLCPIRRWWRKRFIGAARYPRRPVDRWMPCWRTTCDQRLLLVLDNCEHLIDEVRPHRRQTAAACPRCIPDQRTAVVGHRQRNRSKVPSLDVLTCRRCRQLDELAQFGAVQLFARARRQRTDFT